MVSTTCWGGYGEAHFNTVLVEIENTTAALATVFASISGQRPYTQMHTVTCSSQSSSLQWQLASYSEENRILDFTAEKNFRASQYGIGSKKRFQHRFKQKVNRQIVRIGWDTPMWIGLCERITIIFSIPTGRILMTSDIMSQRWLKTLSEILEPFMVCPG